MVRTRMTTMKQNIHIKLIKDEPLKKKVSILVHIARIQNYCEIHIVQCETFASSKKVVVMRASQFLKTECIVNLLISNYFYERFQLLLHQYC